MKLPKGPLKVITFAGLNTLTENELRTRAGGKIFHPTVRVAVKSTDDDTLALVVEGFGVDGLKGEIRSAVATFPYPWAVRNRAYVRYWIETTEAVEVITSID